MLIINSEEGNTMEFRKGKKLEVGFNHLTPKSQEAFTVLLRTIQEQSDLYIVTALLCAAVASTPTGYIDNYGNPMTPLQMLDELVISAKASYIKED